MLQAKLLSDFSFPAPMQMRQPPRIVPETLLKDVRQVEFVGYVANPMYKRVGAPGEATKAVAAMRNMRHQPKQASLNAAPAARTRHVTCLMPSNLCLSEMSWTFADVLSLAQQMLLQHCFVGLHLECPVLLGLLPWCANPNCMLTLVPSS